MQCSVLKLPIHRGHISINFCYSAMSENNNELTTSQINQSEAGPDIVQLDKTLDYTLIKTSDGRNCDIADLMNGSEINDKLNKQPVNVVAPLKIDGRGTLPQQAILEVELAKLHEMLEKQEKLNQQRIADCENDLSERIKQMNLLQAKIRQAEEREKSLNQKILEQEYSQKQLQIVMQDYELLIGKLTTDIVAEKELKQKVEKLESDKETALVHLSNVEAAFSDVHAKYEKCKKVNAFSVILPFLTIFTQVCTYRTPKSILFHLQNTSFQDLLFTI